MAAGKASDDAPRESKATRGTPLFAATNGKDLVSPLTLVFLRHGVTDDTLKHTLSGSGTLGPPLNPAGRVQAAKAADALYRIGRKTWERTPKISRVIASPMVRTQETGAAVGRRLGLKVETDERLQEINFGEWDGMSGEAVAGAFGKAIHEWRFGRIAPPGGESIPDVGERLDGFIREVAAEHAALCRDGDDAPRSYALASHAVAIKSAVGISLKVDPSAWGSIWPQPATYTIIELRVARDGTVAERHLLCLGAIAD